MRQGNPKGIGSLGAMIHCPPSLGATSDELPLEPSSRFLHLAGLAPHATFLRKQVYSLPEQEKGMPPFASLSEAEHFARTLRDTEECLEDHFRYLEETITTRHRIESELRITRESQMSMLPNGLPDGSGYRSSSRNYPWSGDCSRPSCDDAKPPGVSRGILTLNPHYNHAGLLAGNEDEVEPVRGVEQSPFKFTYYLRRACPSHNSRAGIMCAYKLRGQRLDEVANV